MLRYTAIGTIVSIALVIVHIWFYLVHIIPLCPVMSDPALFFGLLAIEVLPLVLIFFDKQFTWGAVIILVLFFVNTTLLGMPFDPPSSPLCP